jgi:pyrroline-5-carboxylate reductase
VTGLRTAAVARPIGKLGHGRGPIDGEEFRARVGGVIQHRCGGGETGRRETEQVQDRGGDLAGLKSENRIPKVERSPKFEVRSPLRRAAQPSDQGHSDFSFRISVFGFPHYHPRMAAQLTLGFLGAGKMASALAKGFVRAKIVAPDQIIASDLAEPARAAFATEVGARTTASNLEVLAFARVIVLAVKPAQTAELLAEIRDQFTPGHLLISIAAGVTLARLEQALNAGARVVRVMPNTPALVGASASAFARGQAAQPADAVLAQRLFAAVGRVFELKEGLLDAVTGLSGSGPAYVYQFIEALSDGGVAAGLPRDVATQLAAQTVLGSARMVLETGLHPGVLKDQVASPGGTTIEGIHALEKGGLRGTVMDAVRAAAEKAGKLGQG